MTTLALIIQPIAFAVILGLVLRHLATRDAARDATTAALLATLNTDRETHRQEVGALLQRIQAPEMAVIQHAQETAEPGETVYPLDDDEQAKAQDRHVAATDLLEKIHEAEAELTA